MIQQAAAINANTVRQRSSIYDRLDLRSNEVFAAWLRAHPQTFVPVFIPPDSEEADQKYFVARIVGKPDIVSEEGLKAGLNTFPKGTHVIELQWFSLQKTAASGNRIYVKDKTFSNDLFNLGSIIRFKHRAFDQARFKLTYNRKLGYVLPATLHEQVIDNMISTTTASRC